MSTSDDVEVFNCVGVGESAGGPKARHICDSALRHYAEYEDSRAAWSVQNVPRFEDLIQVDLDQLVKGKKKKN